MQQPALDGFYSVEWQKTDLEPAPLERPCHWLLAASQDNVLAARVAQNLEGEALCPKRLRLEECAAYLRSADPDAETRILIFLDDRPSISERQGAGNWDWAYSLIEICQAAIGLPAARIWIVTGSGVVGDSRADAVPQQHFAWGFGRAFAAEYPAYFGGLIDVEAQADTHETILRIVGANADEDEWQLRRGRVYVPRLRKLVPDFRGMRVDPDRLHLITGGLKGLSFEIGRALHARGACHVLVVGRSAMDPERDDALRELRALFESAEYLRLDVSSEHDVAELGAAIARSGRQLGCVFHLASSWTIDGRSVVSALPNATREGHEEVLGAKAQGALLLEQLFRSQRGELLVLFSTAAAVLGSPGQINYAAANSVLDGVSEAAVRQGLRAVSISWGPIGGVGFGRHSQGEALHRLWEKFGIKRFSVDEVLAALDAAVNAGRPTVTAIQLDEAATSKLPWLSSRAIFSELVQADASPALASRIDLETIPETERPTFVVSHLRDIIASLLDLPVDDLRADSLLIDIGMDSLIALELVFVVERDLGVSIALNEALLDESVTIQNVADEVLRLLASRSLVATA